MSNIERMERHLEEYARLVGKDGNRPKEISLAWFMEYMLDEFKDLTDRIVELEKTMSEWLGNEEDDGKLKIGGTD